MATMTLPPRARPLIVLSVCLRAASLCLIGRQSHANAAVAILAFFLSGFVVDAFTSLAHFGFDYVFLYRTPVLGPIALEFNEHHDEPTLDPSRYVENLTKGSYASLPILSLLLILVVSVPETNLSFLIEAVVMGMTVWAFFFHRIHAYAHMGSNVPAISQQHGRGNQRAGIEARAKACVRGIVQNGPYTAGNSFPATLPPDPKSAQHNLHHLRFESNFSSING